MYRHISLNVKNEKLFNEFRLLASIDRKAYSEIIWQLVAEYVYGKNTTLDSFMAGKYINYPEITANKQIIFNMFNKMDYESLSKIESNVNYYHSIYYKFLLNRQFNNVSL